MLFMKQETMPTVITRRLEFDAGHRVLGHESKCGNLHGHRYAVEISVAAQSLDTLGRVIDFSEVKKSVGGWIDETLDHTMLLHPADPLLKLPPELLKELFPERRPYVMPEMLNPTAENISWLLFGVATNLLKPKGIEVTCVRVFETPNCWSDYV